MQIRGLNWQHHILTLSIANAKPASRGDSSIQERSAALITRRLSVYNHRSDTGRQPPRAAVYEANVAQNTHRNRPTMLASTASVVGFNPYTLIAVASAITRRNSAKIAQYDATGDAIHKPARRVQTASACLTFSQRLPSSSTSSE